jgi:hypothetical protein
VARKGEGGGGGAKVSPPAPGIPLYVPLLTPLLSPCPPSLPEIARLAAEINRTVENIGARRLHTVIEKIMEDVSFEAADMAAAAAAAVAAPSAVAAGDAAGGDATAAATATRPPLIPVSVDVALVRKKLLPMLEKTDLARFIL